MPDAQLTDRLSPRQTQRPRCPQCQSQMRIQSVAPGRRGFEYWTLRCTKCGLVHEAQVPADPLKSEALGWLDGDLRPPK
jgi:transcription elongation factor Elf1